MISLLPLSVCRSYHIYIFLRFVWFFLMGCAWGFIIIINEIDVELIDLYLPWSTNSSFKMLGRTLAGVNSPGLTL